MCTIAVSVGLSNDVTTRILISMHTGSYTASWHSSHNDGIIPSGLWIGLIYPSDLVSDVCKVCLFG